MDEPYKTIFRLEEAIDGMTREVYGASNRTAQQWKDYRDAARDKLVNLIHDAQPELRVMAKKIRVLEQQQVFCPDHRDKVRDQPCPMCEIETLSRQLDRERDRYNRDVLGLNNEGDAIGGEPARGMKHYSEAYFEQCRALDRIIEDFKETGEYVGLWQHVYELRYPHGEDEGKAAARE